MAFFQKALIPYYLFFGILCFLCRNHIFFWDTYQLCGKQAWALFENGLNHWILPSAIDSGHPPLFGFYHAALWKVFGPNLVVSHLAMFPFLCGIVYFFYQIGAYLIDSTKALYLMPLLIVDPVFMGQAVLASPDIVLIFFMLMCWYGILKQHNIWIIIGAIGLGLISMRGMMVLVALIGFDFFFQLKGSSWKSIIQSLARYSPAVVLVLSFLVYHYVQTGWLGHHKDSSWAESFAYVDAQGLLRNIAVYIWRCLDFGRVFLILALLGILIRLKSGFTGKKIKLNLVFLGLLLLVISPVLLIHKGLVLHRYLLPIFLVTSVLFWFVLFSLPSKQKRNKGIWIICAVALMSGNLWVYPKQISQGWDATLGHLPYYHLRDKMNSYISEQNIPLGEIGTAFPNIGLEKNFDPSKSSNGYKEYDLNQDQYIWYSNVFNDFTDAELDVLASDVWSKEKSFHFYPVCVILYKKEK